MAKYRCAVWLFDETLVALLKNAAGTRQQTMSQLVTDAIRQALVSEQTGSAVCQRCEEIKAKDRARYHRSRVGMPKAKALPAPSAPAPAPEANQRTCPVCDTVFVPLSPHGMRQTYCTPAHTKLVWKHGQDLKKARAAYAKQRDRQLQQQYAMAH
jgi:hypothetical protein